MVQFRDIPLRRKLMAIIMLTTLVALLLASTAFFAYDYLSLRRQLVNDLDSLTQVLEPDLAAAMARGDRRAAKEICGALRARPHVSLAAVLTPQGEVFARYDRDGAAVEQIPRPMLSSGHELDGNKLAFYRPLGSGGTELGILYIHYELQEIGLKLQDYVQILLVVVIGVSLVAFLISSRLQRVVSAPILELAELEKIVSMNKDFSLRARKQGDDEIGMLIDGFNEMLSQIEGRDEELQVARKKAEEANRAKSVFLANMSHELRTPLNAIIGYSEMLEEDADLLGQRDFIPDLQKIREAGKHLLSLINGILDLSKIEAGKMELYLEEFEVSTLVREVANTIKPLVDKNANTLDIHCPESVGTMFADIIKTRQVLFNLLSNASKFTERGRVSLEVRREPGPQGDWICFEVADTGIGMSEEQVERLFRPFSQVDATTTRKYGGTGLGLAISRRFCKLMSGRLSVNSKTDHGSTFTVRLPERVPDPKERSRPFVETTESQELERKAAEAVHIASVDRLALTVDDDIAVHEVLEGVLRKEGFRVERATDGKEGLRKARELKPALMTLDVMLPNMDGWSVLVALKSDPETADIPVLMISVMDDRAQGFAMGAAEYLTKPIDRKTLQSFLQRFRDDWPRSALVVDDEPEARSILRRVLVDEGWEVVEADSGLSGLRRLSERRPQLILLDLVMPELDGFEFVRQLRENPEWRAIPVVIVTAKELSQEERLHLSGGVESILHKAGWSLEELRSEIRSLARHSISK